MEKSRKKLFYKIGEVCRICEIEPHVLRYWETVFTRLRPVKNRAGQRIYRRSDLELIETIKALVYQQGYTISGANARLQEEAVGTKEEMPLFQGPVDARRRRVIQEIKKELADLEELLGD